MWSFSDFPEEISIKFPFFTRLHALLAGRPNVIPIAVTTALGPQGGNRTTWLQPPDGPPPAQGSFNEANIDPRLRSVRSLTSESASSRSGKEFDHPPSPGPGSPVHVSSDDFQHEPQSSVTVTTPSTVTRGPKPSTVTQAAFEKALRKIEHVPKKKSYGGLSDMVEIQK
jgi:hypothetical protein